MGLAGLVELCELCDFTRAVNCGVMQERTFERPHAATATNGSPGARCSMQPGATAMKLCTHPYLTTYLDRLVLSTRQAIIVVSNILHSMYTRTWYGINVEKKVLNEQLQQHLKSTHMAFLLMYLVTYLVTSVVVVRLFDLPFFPTPFIICHLCLLHRHGSDPCTISASTVGR